MPDYDIRIGNIFDELPKLPSESVDLCITSPPYWGLRDYGVSGQLGMEPTLQEYLDHTLEWVKEVYRVLKPSGSFVLNIGDCYISHGNAKDYVYKASATTVMARTNAATPVQPPATRSKEPYCNRQKRKPKEGFPYGKIVSETKFVCRNEAIWCKPNVPSPIRTRLKHSHEKLLWFVKDEGKYYFNAKPWTRAAKARDGKQDFTGAIGAEGRKDNRRQVDLTYAGGTEKNLKTALGEGSFHAYVPETIEHSWRVVPVGEKQKGFEVEEKKDQLHVAPYPESLIKPWVESLCPPGGLIIDPFLGSGTTMKVARDLHRSCIGIELNPAYAAYAEKRCGLKSIKLLQEAGV